MSTPILLSDGSSEENITTTEFCHTVPAVHTFVPVHH